MNKVYIVGNDSDITNMFLRRGWEVVSNIGEEVDLIQFVGGEDVDPSYYNEVKHPATRSNPARDAYEAGIYHAWVDKIPMAGICRGAQFLNVMNGGSMWQHVTNHAISNTHTAFCKATNESLQVTSTHHQMMIPSDEGAVLMITNIAQQKSTASKTVTKNTDLDVEAVFYPETLSLCYQPHPEYVKIDHPCQDKYFEYIENYLL